MSDCSTNAMKPKEQPKTCGHTLVEELHLVQENCIYEREGVINPFHCYDITGEFFDNHIVKKAEELEQRHQQLEQVARELFEEYEQMEVELCDFIGYGKLRDKYVGGTVFKSHLANLGVSLDD